MPGSLEDLGLAAGGKGTGARVSIHNVAAYAGVSIATVSKVMQGVPTVLPENVVKVQNAIEALGYRINPLGAELRRGRRNLIGLIVPTLENAATARLVTELELAVEARAHVLFVASSHESERRETDLAGRMVDWRVAGVIILPVERGEAAALLFEDAALPSVSLCPEGAERPAVGRVLDYSPAAADLGSLSRKAVDAILAAAEHRAPI